VRGGDGNIPTYSADASGDNVLLALRQVLSWLNKPPGWLTQFAFSPEPYGAPVWSPNHIDLIRRDQAKSPIHIVIPRARSYNEFFSDDSLGRFCSYWTWVKKENYLDENDKLFVRLLMKEGDTYISAVDRILSDCQKAKLSRSMNIILSASIFDAFVQNKPAAFINKANSRQLLSEAVGRVKNGTSQINIGTLPYLRQLSPLPSEIKNIDIPDELISKTAFYMSYSAF